jgi:hypothetical protein
MHVNKFSAKAKSKGLNLWLNRISNTLNKYLDVLTKKTSLQIVLVL